MADSGGHELSLIDALLRRFDRRPPSPQVIVGPGDDAAVLSGGPICVTSVDAAIEGVHFELGDGRYSCADVGYKALASAVSDLAAMGVAARDAYLTLCMPDGFAEADALAIADGAAEIATATETAIVGGDVVVAPQLGVCATVVGWAETAQAPVRRAGGRAGDLVGVTGTLGAAGAGLAAMQGRIALAPAAAKRALGRARRPQPRLREGGALARAGAHAMIDLSDGLATDAAHLGRASGLLLELDLSLLPLGDGVAEAGDQLEVAPWWLAATAGEDYELCVCVAPAQQERVERELGQAGGVGIAWIGEARPSEGIGGAGGARFTLGGEEVPLTGFEHRW